MVEVIVVLAPHLLWAVLLVWVLRRVGWATVRDMLERVSEVEVAGMRVAIESGVKSAAEAQNVAVPLEERTIVAERLRKAQRRVAGTRMLWIDDYPAGNKAEMSVLNGLGATIDVARSDSEARKQLDGGVYDVVLSDIKRGESQDAGIKFLPVIRDAPLGPAVIFYVRESKGTPDGAFGIATRPDELMHLIVDALERRGY